MNINFVNFKGKIAKLIIPKLEECLNLSTKVLSITNELDLTITLVTKSVIKKMNASTRGVNKVTDVLSYPNLNLNPTTTKKLSQLLTKDNFKNDVNPETGNIFIGDILICLPVIKKQAKIYGSGFEREMCYMTVHGLLHLLGFDHLKESDQKQMREIEEKILNNVGLSKEKK